jgi:hypothetical protein
MNKEIIIDSPKHGQKIILVDAEDYERLIVHKWTIAKKWNTFYAYSWKGKKWASNQLMHRFILGITDPQIIIDHKDRNGLNNQKDNLRIATPSQSSINRKYSHGSSKYVGVSKNKESNKWVASIKKDGVRTHIGMFEKEEDAAIAYNKKAVELHGDFANLNQF